MQFIVATAFIHFNVNLVAAPLFNVTRKLHLLEHSYLNENNAMKLQTFLSLNGAHPFVRTSKQNRFFFFFLFFSPKAKH